MVPDWIKLSMKPRKQKISPLDEALHHIKGQNGYGTSQFKPAQSTRLSYTDKERMI